MDDHFEKKVMELISAKEVFEKFFGSDPITTHIHQSKNVVSCEKCSGTGFVSREELADYHRGEYSTITNECSNCKGSGRQVEVKSEISFESSYRYSDAKSTRVEKIPYPEDPIKYPSLHVFSVDLKTVLDEDHFEERKNYLLSKIKP